MKTYDSQKKRDILYLSYDGLTDSLGQSQILPYLTGLSDEGFSMTIISFEKPDRFKQYQKEINEICFRHAISWRPLIYHKNPPVVSTIFDLVTLRVEVEKSFRLHRFHIIHCRSYLTSLVGLWAKQKFGVKFIFDMRGFWADERVDGGLWNLSNPVFSLVYKFFKRKEKKFIKDADHVISLTQNAHLEILSWGFNDTPITVIPTCVDMDLFDPNKYISEALKTRRELSLDEDTFVLIYVGSWGTWYMTDEMLQFFSVLMSMGKKTALLILTPDRPDLSNYQYASHVIVKTVSRKNMPVFLTVGDATICFIRPTFSKKASSATKMAEAWAMNLPVVTNSGWGDIDHLMKSGLPLLVCNSPAEYKTIARSLIDEHPRFNRHALFGKFDLVSAIAKYKSIYQSLTV